MAHVLHALYNFSFRKPKRVCDMDTYVKHVCLNEKNDPSSSKTSHMGGLISASSNRRVLGES